MLKRKAEAVWQGTGKEGHGTISTESKTLNNAPYSFATRFEEHSGTNPEELIGAAHAGCFSMALAFKLSEAGFTPTELKTSATISMDKQKSGWVVTESHLSLHATIPNITQENFQAIAEEAKKGCPISQLLNANITLDTNLTTTQ